MGLGEWLLYRNWDLRMKTGTKWGGWSSIGCLAASQLVATPLFVRPVGVVYLTKTAVTWTHSGYNYLNVN